MLTRFWTKVILPRLQVWYTSILKKIQQHQYMSEFVKLWGLISMFLLTVGLYLYYINASSTLGYYLRQEERSLSNKKFEYNALLLERLQLQQNLWNKLSTQTQWLTLSDNTSSDLIRISIPIDTW